MSSYDVEDTSVTHEAQLAAQSYFQQGTCLSLLRVLCTPAGQQLTKNLARAIMQSESDKAFDFRLSSVKLAMQQLETVRHDSCSAEEAKVVLMKLLALTRDVADYTVNASKRFLARHDTFFALNI